MSPQPSSFVGYIENYGIKLWRPFKQQYSIGRNGHRPKWLWAEWSWTDMFLGQNDPEPLYQRTNGPVNTHLISWPSKAQNIQNLENIW